MRSELVVALIACMATPSIPATAVPIPRTPPSQAGSAEQPSVPGKLPQKGPGIREPAVPPEERFEHDMMVRYHMHGNLDLLRAIERLIIQGKLDEARGLARGMAEAPTLPGLGSWAPRATAVRERAAALAAAPGSDEACRRAARLAEACAKCHIEAGVQPQFRSPPPLPPDRDTPAARMARHRWAADRLWEGLVGADPEPWQAGLAVLAQPPIRWPELGERKGLAKMLQQQADQARQRATTDTIEDRARFYGEMLVTCTACHTAPARP